MHTENQVSEEAEILKKTIAQLGSNIKYTVL